MAFPIEHLWLAFCSCKTTLKTQEVLYLLELNSGGNSDSHCFFVSFGFCWFVFKLITKLPTSFLGFPFLLHNHSNIFWPSAFLRRHTLTIHKISMPAFNFLLFFFNLEVGAGSFFFFFPSPQDFTEEKQTMKNHSTKNYK